MSEDAIKRKCVKFLKQASAKNEHLWFYCPTDRFYSGIPDIFICYKGHFATAELKTERGKVTPIQKYTMDQLAAAGCATTVCRSSDELAQFLMTFMMKINGKEVI